MAKITPLVVTEIIKVDSRRVHDFVTELGEEAAGRVVEQAINRLEQMVIAIDIAVSKLDLVQVAMHTKQLSRLAWQIGLVSLSNVATDLMNCTEQNDIEALLVVKARIIRVVARSLAVLQDAKEVGQG